MDIISSFKPNSMHFKRSFCELFLIYKLLRKETKPKKIAHHLHLIGFNYVFYKEFVLSVVWYMHNISLYGAEEDLLDVIKYFKDIIKFYPRTPFLYFIMKKLYEYLSKNEFYNYESDFFYLLELTDVILKEFGPYFPKNKFKLLKKYQDKLESEKEKYTAYKILDNIDNQFILVINMCQTLITKEEINENIKILCLMILVYNFKSLELYKLATKYSNILKNKYDIDY